MKTGPKAPHSTTLTEAEEAAVVAFRRHTLLPLDDCLYALQPSIPHLTRSALHRCLQRHGISRLPDVEGDKPKRQRFKRYPIGFFHMDIAEVQTAEGKLYLFVAIDRTSKFAVTRLVDKADRRTAWEFLEHRTNLFRAAIASSGRYDLAGGYSQPQYWADRLVDSMSWFERSQPRLGQPLWDDPVRYIENSPYFLADRIRTPLLIIQGSSDPVGSFEAGKMFAALRRLGRDAELAMYDGAGHQPSAWRPEQAADQAARTLDFMDRYLLDLPDGD